MSVTQRIVWVAIAAACAAVLALRVDVRFERTRLRLPMAPITAQGGSAAVVLPDTSRLGGAASAVIVRLRGIAEPAAATVLVDDVEIARATIPANREVRVDGAAVVPPGRPHHLVVRGDRDGWQLTYVEVASVHGFTRGVLDLLIAPRERRGNLPPWWLATLVGLLLLVVRPTSTWHRRWARHAHRTGCSITALLFGAALLSPAVTPYRLLFSIETFLLLVAVIYAEPLVRSIAGYMPPVAVIRRRLVPLVPHLAVVALILWSVGQLYRPGTGFTSLILFGRNQETSTLMSLRTVPHWSDPGAGYDGQYYAQVALDPLLRSDGIRTALDTPAYRARRILLPWSAYVLGLGQPYWVLQAYSLLNVACWLALGWILLAWLPPGAIRPVLCWIACMMSEGMLLSIRQSLPDGPSMLLIAAAVLAVERNRRWLATAALGLAGLTRETNLLALSALAPKPLTVRTTALAALRVLAAIVPLALWIAYLTSLGFDQEQAGLRNFALPLTAYADKLTESVGFLRQGGWFSVARFSVLSIVALSVQAIFLALRLEWTDTWWRVGVAYVALMVMLGPAVWEGYPSAAARVVVPMTVAFNVLLARVRGPWFWPIWIVGNASILSGADPLQVPWLS